MFTNQAGVGVNTSFNIDWITRGNDASFVPYGSKTHGLQVGSRATIEGSIGISTGWYYHSDLRLMPKNSVANGLLDWSGYGGGNISALGSFSAFGGVGFSEGLGSTPTWFSGGIGIGVGIGGGGSVGASLTTPLNPRHFNK